MSISGCVKRSSSRGSFEPSHNEEDAPPHTVFSDREYVNSINNSANRIKSIVETR